MNILLINELQNELENFNDNVIERINGKYDVNTIVEMLKLKEYKHIILDITAIENYGDYKVFGILTQAIEPQKIILLLPEGGSLFTPNYLSRLIAYGLYNFTTNCKGISYLLLKPNSYADVEKIDKLSTNDQQDRLVERNAKLDKLYPNKKKYVIGFRNITPKAGATTLIYMIFKEIVATYGEQNAVAIEVNKADFELFHFNNMYSMSKEDLQLNLQKLYQVPYILIDLNDYPDDSVCTDVVYLLEPSTIMMNKMIRTDNRIFEGLADKTLVLNKSLMENKDIYDFQQDSGAKVFYNMPPLDERKKNIEIISFAKKLGLIGIDAKGVGTSTTAKIFGLFRR